MRPLPKATVQNATVQFRQGKSAREVAKSLKISLGSALRIRREDKEHIPDPRLGRPSKVSKRTRKALAHKFETGELQDIRDGQRFVQSVDGVWVHEQSIRNYLKSEGLKYDWKNVMRSRDWYGMNRVRFIFQQDNAKVHIATLAMQYLLESKIRILEWPANFHDLNPIENLWAYLKAT
ncbi:Galactose-3-O-sulfotransferase 3 [Mortierella sp. AM989]|nr:Galactose-3-O-sulfotransferase 3 [Mortierella sp. AM989]